MTEFVDNPHPTQNQQPDFIEESPGVFKPPFLFTNNALDFVVSNKDFKELYPASTEVERKYSIARALIADGGIDDVRFLLDGLVPTPQTLSRSSVSEERKQEVLDKGKILKESLTNFMVEKGLIEPPNWNLKKASQEADRYITNNTRLKELVTFFGASNAADILYRLHPHFRGIQPEKVNGIIADYLGDFLLQAAPLNLNNISDKLPYLSEPNLKEGLIEVWKRDVLHRISHIRNQGSLGSEREMVTKVFDEYRHQSEGITDEVFQSTFQDVESYYQSLFDLEKPSILVDSLNGGRPFPDLNQRINIKELEEKKRLLIADEMGLGKSASAILAKEKLGVKNALVLAPSNVISVWQNFLSDQVEVDGKPKGYFKPGQAPRVFTVESPEQLSGINSEEYDYILLSQERLNDSHMNSIRDLNVGMLIVDEFHKLKNLIGGVRAGHLLDLSKKMEGENKYIALLSGTPIPNKVEDIAIALKLLYPDKFENTDNATLIRSIIQGDIVDLRNLLLPRMQAKELSESLLMPELTEKEDHYELTGVEKDIYEEILDDDELSSTAKLQLLRQFLLNPSFVDPTPGIVGSKIQNMDERIIQQLQLKDKLVVFVNDFTNGVIRGDKTIFDNLHIPDGVRVEIIDGPVGYEDRQRIQTELSQSNEKMIVFVSGQTADVGVDFSSADTVDFYNEPWSKFNKRQQLARVYRPGVKQPIESLTSIGEGTIEEGIHRYIAAKEQAILKLLKGIPTTEIEKQLLENDDKDVDQSLGVNPELAEYYFSSWDRMNKIFAVVKERGEEEFTKFLQKYARQYAGAYADLGTRSYQANAGRVCGSLIDRIVNERGEVKQELQILDIASGPQMLARHIPNGYEGRVISFDINKHHFNSESKDSIVGSFLNLPIKNESVDYATLSLAWHYTSFAPSKDNLERIEVLAEANRVLKKGGRLIMNNIYSLDIKNEKLFEELVWAIGFKIVPEYSGEVANAGTYNSRVFTLEKIEYPGLSPQEIAELIGKDHYDGLKFVKSDTRIRDSRKVLEEFNLGDNTFSTNLNTEDNQILAYEKDITAAGEELKNRFGSIQAIPANEIIDNDFVRILVGNKYVLFKKIPQSSGAVVIK